MASNVFPMLSSSPPPIDDCPDDDDDDDEFGNFASANIPFDSSFDSPVASDKFKTFKTDENGVNDINLKNDLNKFHYNGSSTPPLEEFVQSLTENQSNEGFSCNKLDTSDFPYENNYSSLECSTPPLSEFASDSKTNHFSSHKAVPEVCDSTYRVKNSWGACEDNDSVKSFDIPSCSSDENVCQNKSDSSHLQEISGDKENWKPFSEASNALNDVGESENFCSNDKSSLPETSSDALTHETKLSKKLEHDFQSTSDIKVPPFDESSYKERDFTARNCSPDSYCSEKCEDFDEFQQAGFESNTFNNLPASTAVNLTKFSHKSSTSDGTFVVLNESSSGLQASEIFHQHHDSDDFDDYQGCGRSICDSDNVALNNSISSLYNVTESDEVRSENRADQELSDFADFQDFSKVEASIADDFADFETAPYESNKQFKQSESCEFADFESAQFASSNENSSVLSCSSHTSAIVQEKSVDKLSTVINTIFPIPDGLTNVDAADEPVSEILEQSNKSRRLWEKLHEIEQTPGLRFQWGVSHSFQQLLRSVNVDYHSILRTSSVPIFASSLSLLEPVKGHSSSVNHELEDRNLSPKDPIPPVEFDWNSSGLVNPLDSCQAISTLMDLSFLSSSANDGPISSGDHSFENELLKPSPLPSHSESSEKNHILEQLLSKNVSSLPNSKISHRPSNLSEEAVRVLDQLPDLSFMQAKVLMFPISNKT